ncbi:hypothetical protein LCGC14_2213660, partial [marine sediment metagenome]
MSASETASPIRVLRPPKIEWWDPELIFPHCTKAEISRFPIIEAYGKITDEANKLNKKARNYNIKTNLKIALFVTTCFALGIGITFASFSLAGIAVSYIAPLSLKVIAAMGITFAVFKKITPIFSKPMNKTQNEFASKMNSKLKKMYKSKDIKEALDQRIDACVYINASEFCQSHYSFTVSKVQFAPYRTVEKNYVDIKI